MTAFFSNIVRESIQLSSPSQVHQTADQSRETRSRVCKEPRIEVVTGVRIRIRGIGRGVMIILRRVEMGVRGRLVRGESRVVEELEGHLMRGEVLGAGSSRLNKAPSILHVLLRAELERIVGRGGVGRGRDERIVGGDGRGKVVQHHGHHDLVLGEYGRVGGRVPEWRVAAMSIHVL